uniref:Putative transcription initiation factor tfiid subunit 3 n=1 Tax=Culex tarsalis TaxID=7177 RepID=A0A1Q3G264_CULTA
MSERYTHQLLKVVVAQVCQTIGWHSIQSTPLELLIDILDQYLRDITSLTHRYSELYNRTDPNLDDVALAFREIGTNLGELQEYLQFVDPIERPFEVPRYPLPKESHLNFLKPGSKEVLTRPVHIPEHMPPMLVDVEEEQQEEARRRMLRLRSEPRVMEVEEMSGADFGGMVVEKMEEVGAEEVALMETSQNEEVVTFKRPPEVAMKSEEGRPTREISSVIMTTSGFISPAREGKLPDSKIPEIPEEKPKLPPPPPPAPVLPVAKMDEKFGGKKGKKRPAEKEKKKDKKGEKKNESRPASRPVTPTAELPPSSVTEDIKPLVEAPQEELPKEPTPAVPDVKPPPETLVPPAPEVQPPPAIPPILPETPVKVKKEKPKRKKPPLKSPQPPPHMMMNSPLMDVGLFAPFPAAQQQQQPPPLIPPMALMNQITPPKPPKPKRPKITKKQLLAQQQQQFQAPLNAQNILDIMTGNSGAKMPPNLFSPQPPSLFPPQQQQQTQLHAAQTQLDILQKLHPSLEITPAPGPQASPEKHKLNVFKKVGKTTKTSPNAPPPPPLTSSGPIIVIDDDKSPPHAPQFPITPMAKKRTTKNNTPSTGGFQFQDTLSSPDFAMNPEPPPSSSFREISPPKTPSNMPKTPDIKLQSSSSSSTSWMSDSGKLSGGPGPLFGDFPPNFGLGALPLPKEEKKKKPPRQRPVKDVAPKKSKNAQLMDDMLQQFQQQQQHQQQLPPVLPGLDKKQLSEYSKLLNQAMPSAAAALFNNPAVRNPMFGMFPLPSGPGLIPDNPLFGTFPGQPSFLPTGPFGMPPIPPRFDLNMLRYPRPPKPTPPETFDSLDPETKLAHTPLDLQKSTCNVAPLVPPSLHLESTPKTPPPPSIPRQPPPQEHSLNLSTKPSSVITPNPTHELSTVISAPQPQIIQQQLAAPAPNVPPITPGETIVIGSDSDTNSQSEQIPMSGDGGGALGAAGEEDEEMQPEGAKKDKSEKRKSKEHKKDRKMKEGKIKKKKDKKDKNRSKERDRERPKSSHSFHLDTTGAGSEIDIPRDTPGPSSFASPDLGHHSPPPSATVIPAGFLIDPNATGLPVNPPVPAPPAPVGLDQPDVAALEAIRRKEKKEKKKEKMKKEKRKEKERAAAAAAELGGMLGSPIPGVPLGSSGSDYTDGSQPSAVPATSVPKLMLKLGPGSRAGTPEVHQQQQQPEVGGEPKREASPELARISALVTRPPKLKTPGGKSGGKSKEDEPKVGSKSGLESKAAGKLDFTGDPAKPRPRGIQALPDTIDLFSVTPSVATPSKISPLAPTTTVPGLVPGTSGADLTQHSSKKPPKEPKSSSKSHASGVGGSLSSSSSSVVPSLGVAIPAPLSTPITQLKDADGNVVWICPACGRVDDGTPMIGCDGCDAWYHWVCVGIQVPPDSNEDWYCRVCIGRKQQGGDTERQKKRKKKDKRTPKD